MSFKSFNIFNSTFAIALCFTAMVAISQQSFAAKDPEKAAIADAKRAWLAARAVNSPDTVRLKKIWMNLSDAQNAPEKNESNHVVTVPSANIPVNLESRVLSLGAKMANLVPPTCEAPAAPSGRVLYIDPAKGSSSGDGSLSRPYRTLAEVLGSSNIRSTLRAGDTFLLASGSHGLVKVGSNFGNGGTLYFKAAPGAEPVIRGMNIEGTGRMVFEGLHFTDLVRLKDNNWLIRTNPTASNLIFRGNKFYTQKDISVWSDKEMTKNTDNGVFSRSTCTTYVSNEFFNLNNALRLGGDKMLAAGNHFHDVMNDNILITASDLIIRYNAIMQGRNNIENAKIQHSDGMQGWAEGGLTNKNITIDSNFVFNYIPFAPGSLKPGMTEMEKNDLGTYRQGISIFDGKWDGLMVTNNVVITNADGGMVFRGPNNALIANNVVLSSDPANYRAEIAVRQAKDRSAFKNVKVANNIAANYASTTGVESINNVKVTDTSDFVKISVGDKIFDARLTDKSSALLAGDSKYATVTDILGNPRRQVNGKVDAGALSK